MIKDVLVDGLHVEYVEYFGGILGSHLANGTLQAADSLWMSFSNSSGIYRIPRLKQWLAVGEYAETIDVESYLASAQFKTIS